jgi:hypothetical protein
MRILFGYGSSVLQRTFLLNRNDLRSGSRIVAINTHVGVLKATSL